MKLLTLVILGLVASFAARSQCRNVSRDFRYPKASRELIRDDVELSKMAGVVQLTLSDSEVGEVLVELMDEHYVERSRACLTDNRGKFSLRLAPGLYFARFSKPGFVSVRIPVRIGKKGKPQLLVRMSPG